MPARESWFLCPFDKIGVGWPRPDILYHFKIINDRPRPEEIALFCDDCQMMTNNSSSRGFILHKKHTIRKFNDIL